MSIERVRQRTDIVDALRYWVTPLAARLREEPPPDVHEVVSGISKLDLNRPSLLNLAQPYCSDEGRAYFTAFQKPVTGVVRQADNISLVFVSRALTGDELRTEYKVLADALDRAHNEALDILMRVPVNWEAVRFEKGDRLAATQYLGRLIRGVRDRVHIFDRYLDRTLIDYMDDLPRDVEIRLVTTKGSSESYGAKKLLPVAAIAAAQYPNLQLVQVDQQDLHLRCIRVDDQIFRSDQSFRDLALVDGPHFSAPKTGADEHRELDAIIEQGQTINLQANEELA